MKNILLFTTCISILWITKVQSQSLSQTPSNDVSNLMKVSEINTNPNSRNSLFPCNPPFHVMGLHNPDDPNDPNPALFGPGVQAEIMSDGLQGIDKEYGDVNGDGLIDILYTTNANKLWYIPNTGNISTPDYQLSNKIFTGFTGVYSFRIVDWYADGINDLAVLEKFPGNPANITLYLDIKNQIGSPTPAATLIDGNQAPVNAGQFIEMGDIDGDQYPEILVSGQSSINGTAYFKNLGTGWLLPPVYRLIAPQTYSSPMIPEDGGSSPVPELFDADCDGDLDLFISDPLWIGGGGHVDFYENTGMGSPYIFFTKISPNPYGLDDIPSPNTDLSCDWIITRFADFFGDGCSEAIASNPCQATVLYYANICTCRASYIFFNPESCQSFHFVSSSTSSIPLTYAWNFGDPASGINDTSSLQDPAHSFTVCDSFHVCLIISGSGCMDTFCQWINVHDPSPPVAICLDGISIMLDGNCMATLSPTQIDNGSFDNCMLSSLSLSPDTFNQCGVYPVTLTATDWCGNTNTCLSQIQVHEEVPPFIRCPSNVISTSASPDCTLAVNGLHWLALSDNCGSAAVSYIVTGASNFSGTGDASGQIFNHGTSTVTYTATDGCGNTSTCSFTVNVNCVCNCENNLLQNAGFNEGAVAGNLESGGHSNQWHTATQTPQIISIDSCCDAYSVQMWGWLYNGESLYQDGLSFTAGHHYKISFCGKYLPSNPAANNVSFGFTAANTVITPFQCTTNCEDIGSSPQISNQNWMTYTLPVWTPTQNWNKLFIRVFNSMGIKTWGRIDNICVQEVTRTCCTDEDAFIENARNAIDIYTGLSGEDGIFEVGNLPACDSIAYIDWGDGHTTQGPIAGKTKQKNYFINNIKARVQWEVVEYNQNVDPAVPCFTHVFSDSIQVGGPDTCVCSSFSELFMQSSSGLMHHLLDYDSSPIVLTCSETGSGYEITGLFQCAGRACGDEWPVTWMLAGPDGNNSGIENANPYFGIHLFPTYFKTPGTYTLQLQGQCGNSSCSSFIQFIVDCPDACPCSVQDIEDFHAAVDRSFARLMRPDFGCNVYFSPIALSDCETVTWFLTDTIGTPIGESVGRQSFNYTFSESGTYTIIMEVTKKKADGSTCDKQMRSQQVTVTCQHVSDCLNSVIDNPGFSEGAAAGGLNSGGRSLGWNALEGEPTVVEGLEGSLDGWTIRLSGNHDTADVLSRYEPICLGKSIGRCSTTVKSSKSNGSERKFGGTLRIFIGRGWSFPPVGFSLNECGGINCFELASVALPAGDSSEWFDVQIPYDLSRWAALDDCSGFPGVMVRPAIFVTNALGSDQGGVNTYSSAQIDNFCFNGTLVALHDPIPKQNIRIYPNPNSGEFTVELGEPAKTGFSLRVISLTGQVIFAKKADTGTTLQQMELNNISSGMYFLQIISDNKLMETSRFVKQ